MGHVVLLGDSIFDNASYVPGHPPVIEQVRQALPKGWLASLLAVDGEFVEDVANQLKNLPADATHLVISAGGNDVLREQSVLSETVYAVSEALGLIHEARSRFRESYRSMLQTLSTIGKPVAVCTVYDAIPGLTPSEQTALASFNEVILCEAFSARLPVIDLRLLCDLQSDYSHISPIEPSVQGGAKIARVIAEVATTHDFSLRRSMIYV